MHSIDKVINHIESLIDNSRSNYIFLSIDTLFVSMLLNLRKETGKLVEELGNFFTTNYTNKTDKFVFIQAYNLDFPKQRIFYKSSSLSIPSALGLYLIKKKINNRTNNPMYSFFFSNDSHVLEGFNKPKVFGLNSIFEHIINLDTELITLGQHYVASLTSCHHAESIAGVDYREDIIFDGKTIDYDLTEHKSSAIFFGRKRDQCLFSGLSEFGEKVITSNKKIVYRHTIENANGLYGYGVSLKKINDLFINDLLEEQKLLGVIKADFNELPISSPEHERKLYLKKIKI